MEVGFVVYGGLDGRSGGYRYDRKLVEHFRDRGDAVEVIGLPDRPYLRAATHGYSRAIRRQLDRPVDVLLQDELCHPSLWRHNRRLTNPGAIVTLVHLLRSADPTSRFPRVSRALERRYFSSVDGAVCVSRATRTAVGELARVPVTVAYPAGRRERAVPDPASVQERAADDPLEIGFVGNLVPRKGVLTLLAALDGLDGPWRATIVGSHEANAAYARRVRRRAATHEAADRIEVTGAVSDERLDAVLSRVDVLAVPSRRESFGMVYLEAMEHGTVPIATAAGGPREFVVDGHNGCLVPPRDPAPLRAALETLLVDRDMLAMLARGALETADAHPTWEESMERVRRFVRAVAAGDTAGDPPPNAHRERSVAGGVSRRQAREIDGRRPPADEEPTP